MWSSFWVALYGEGRVGKTSLAKALTIPDYQLEDEQTTEGIDIHTWMIPKEKLGIEKDFRVNIWDFGGQEIYHATHQFFLTKRSLYLLITESRREDNHDTFYYWFNIIQLLGDRSPILVVLNKCDQPTKDIPVGSYQRSFDTIVHPQPIRISCAHGYAHTLTTLKSEIGRILTDKAWLPHMGETLPAVWIDIREALEALRSQGKDHITRSEYLARCAEYGMNEERADFLGDYFHDIGVILHYRNDFALRNLVVLNFEWVTAAVYKVLESERVKEQQGAFYDRDLVVIWHETKYQERGQELLALMRNRKFELCYDLPTGGYLAPQLLPIDEPTYTWRSEQHNLRFEYRYKFMPKGILSRFIVKRHRDIHQQTQWRYGVLLDYEDTRALVQEDYFQRKINIRLEGPSKKGLLDIIRMTLGEIHDNFNNLTFDEMIPCNCHECGESDSPYFYPYERLKRFLKKGRQYITCDQSVEDVAIHSMLDDTLLEDSRYNTRQLRHYLAELYHDHSDIRRVLDLFGIKPHGALSPILYTRVAAICHIGQIINLFDIVHMKQSRRMSYFRTTLLADAGINSIRIHFGTAVENIWQSVIEETTRSGQLDALIRIARSEYGHHPALQIR